MTESADISYQLASFSSLFEVAVALNLLFSFWDTLRNQAVYNFQKIAKEIETKLEVSLGLGDGFKMSRCSTKLSKKQSKYEKTLFSISKFAKIAGVLATLILVSILILIGFAPTTQIGIKMIWLIIFISVGVSPLSLLVGNIYVNHAKKRLEEFGDQQNTAAEDLKEAYASK